MQLPAADLRTHVAAQEKGVVGIPNAHEIVASVTNHVSAVRQFGPLNCSNCGGSGHRASDCSSARGVTIHDDGTSAPATGVNRTLRSPSRPHP